MMDRRRIWILNLDAELELETIGSYTRSEHMQRVVNNQQQQLIGTLVAPTDVILTAQNHASHVHSGDLAGLPGYAWCPTPSACHLLRTVGAVIESEMPIEVLRTINARPFGLEVRRDLIGDSFTKHLAYDLEEALSLIAQPAEQGWLLRRSFGAAGRGRRKIATGKPNQPERSWIEASLRTGPLTIEPWVQIVREFTRSGWVTSDGGVTLAPPCLQETDTSGAWLRSQEAAPLDIESHLDERLQEAFEQAGRAIAAVGYSGPFGVDAYLHRNQQGHLALNPLSEINGRYTMDWGLVKGPSPGNTGRRSSPSAKL